MASKTLEQLIMEINEKVEREEHEKKASATSNLADLWMDAMTNNKTEEDKEMLNKMAAAEDALDTMSILYANDLLVGEMTKQASVMYKEAAQNMVIAHCMQFGWSPDDIIMKEASDRALGNVMHMAEVGADNFWAGFMKAAADDASAGPAGGANGPAPNMVSNDYVGYRDSAPDMNKAVGEVMPLDAGYTTIDALIEKVLSGGNYGMQGYLRHDFLPRM